MFSVTAHAPTEAYPLLLLSAVVEMLSYIEHRKKTSWNTISPLQLYMHISLSSLRVYLSSMSCCPRCIFALSLALFIPTAQTLCFSRLPRQPDRGVYEPPLATAAYSDTPALSTQTPRSLSSSSQNTEVRHLRLQPSVHPTALPTNQAFQEPLYPCSPI